MIELTVPKQRRWWQFWKSQQWLQTVVEVPNDTRVGDVVQLQQQRRTDGRLQYNVTVNGSAVLEWVQQ